MLKHRTAVVAAGIALVALAAAGCNRGSSSGSSAASGGTGGGGGKVGIDQPRSDSDFWNSYSKYIESGISSTGIDALRSDEHTSELQSRGHLVCRLPLDKKNHTTTSGICAMDWL